MSSTNTQLPEPVVAGVAAFIATESVVRQKFYALVSGLAPGEGIFSRSSELAAETGLSEEEAEKLLHFVYLAISFDVDRRVDADRFWEELKTVFEAHRAKVGLYEELRDVVRRSGHARMTLKADQLMQERTNLLSTSRLLTDFRPVFDGENGGLEVDTGAIIHTLCIDYYSAPFDEIRHLHIAISEAKMQDLIDELGRGLKKSGKLAEKLGSVLTVIRHE